MKVLDATFKEEKNLEANKPIFLYTIYDYDSAGTNFYFAEYDIDVVYDGQTYVRFPIKHEFISENIQSEIDQIKISISNISRLMQAHLELHDFRTKKVSIKQVWANQLADVDAYIEDVYYVDSYTATEETVEFTLSSKFDVLSIILPRRMYSRNYCQWKFKGTECGYAGAETECNKTKVRCKVLNNYSRFGGFPSIPTRQIYVG